ncbi:Uncharacterised protein [Mycobacteroides abscessus subsp. abscessus]|nr:Uncharacterised protein [Mycobacteroides abscessus subsp. abscessus]
MNNGSGSAGADAMSKGGALPDRTGSARRKERPPSASSQRTARPPRVDRVLPFHMPPEPQVTGFLSPPRGGYREDLAAAGR